MDLGFAPTQGRNCSEHVYQEAGILGPSKNSAYHLSKIIYCMLGTKYFFFSKILFI